MSRKRRLLYARRFKAWQACMDFGFKWGLQLARHRRPNEDPFEVLREQLEEGSRRHQEAMVALAKRLSEVYVRETQRTHRRGTVRRG
jgi:hypothetical protein